MIAMFGLGVSEILLLVIVITVAAGVAGKRPAIALGIAGLGLVGVMLLASVFYFFRSMPAHSVPPRAEMWGGPNGSMSVSWKDDGYRAMMPNEMHAQWRTPAWGMLGIVMLAGVAVAVLALLRRSRGACAVGHHRAWWPAGLLLLLPLGFFFFVSRTHVQRSVTYSTRYDAEMHAREIHQRVARQQAELERRQAVIAHRTSKLDSELKQRIDNMEIHKLMDLVDAPRIMLPIPTPATIAMWAKATAAQEPTGEATSAAGASEEHTADEAAVHAEADAAVELIAAENDDIADDETGRSHGAVDSDVSEDTRAVAASTVASNPAAVSAEAQPHSRSESRAIASVQSRPKWIDEMPKRVGNTLREVIVTEEYATEEECRLARDVYILLATYDHLQELTGNIGAGGSYPSLTFQRGEVVIGARTYPITAVDPRLSAMRDLGIGVNYIRREIAKEEYLQTIERSFGPMKQLYTLLEFSPSVDRELRHRWEASQRQERFAFVGFGATSILSLLGLAWGLLKVDTWTKGYYTMRLFLGVPMAIMGTLAIILFLLN